MIKKSVFVVFLNSPSGRAYEYLVPPEIYYTLKVGSIVLAGSGLGRVTGLQPVATDRATVVIKGVLIEQEICTSYAVELKIAERRAEALSRKEELLRELDHINQILGNK